MSFYIVKDSIPSTKGNRPFRLPFGNPATLAIQPKGSMVYSSIDGFIYISDGTVWDRVSGVNNPVDLLLPVTQHRMAKWTEDYPPGSAYPSPVLQDSSLEVDDDGNMTLSDTGNTPSSFPWANGNMMAHGSMVSSYTFGQSLDPADPTVFTPVITQLPGGNPDESSSITFSGDSGTSPREKQRTKELYDTGSIAIGHAAMENIVMTGPDSKTMKNVAIGVGAGKNIVQKSENNTCIGWNSMKGVPLTSGGNSTFTGNNNVVVGSDAVSHISGTDSTTAVGVQTAVGEGSRGAVVMGAYASALTSGNVIVGTNTHDASRTNIVAIGSDVKALGDNRLVIGSGVFPVSSDGKIEATGMYMTIQIGDRSYLLPLYQVNH